MISFSLQPVVYTTDPTKDTLQSHLDKMWGEAPSGSTATIVAGFGNLNGVLPFVKSLKKIAESGEVLAFFGAATGQRMASIQLVCELLTLGATVNLLTRKKIMHAKLYGLEQSGNAALIVSSGNFTGSGIALNVEASLYVDGDELEKMDFSWPDVRQELLATFNWTTLTPGDLEDDKHPGWKLVFDEESADPRSMETWVEGDEVLGMTLSPTDVNRVTGKQKLGTQYFWLSRFVAGFFPPLTDLPDKSDAKRTFKTTVNVDFLDLGEAADMTVTFEAYNNLDFRLLTSPLKGTNVAEEGDMMLLRRVDERKYHLRIIRKGSKDFARLIPYLVHSIGIKEKRYGWVPLALAKPLT